MACRSPSMAPTGGVASTCPRREHRFQPISKIGAEVDLFGFLVPNVALGGTDRAGLSLRSDAAIDVVHADREGCTRRDVTCRGRRAERDWYVHAIKLGVFRRN